MANQFYNLNKSTFNLPLNRVSVYVNDIWQFVPEPNSSILLFSEGTNDYYTPGVKFGLHQPNAVYPNRPAILAQKEDILVRDRKRGIFSVMTRETFDRRYKDIKPGKAAPTQSKDLDNKILTEQSLKTRAPLSNTIATPPQVRQNRQPLLSKTDPTGRR